MMNDLCKTCTKSCKQTSIVKLLSCPRFERRTEQVELKLTYPKRGGTRATRHRA